MIKPLQDGEMYYLHRVETGFTMAVLSKRNGKHYGHHPINGESEVSNKQAKEVCEYIATEMKGGCKLLKEENQ